MTKTCAQRLIGVALGVLLCVTGSRGADAQDVVAAESQRSIDALLDSFASAEFFWQQGDIAQELVAAGDDSIISRIRALLDTPDRRRRCNAAFVLAGLGDARGMTALIEELEDTSFDGRSIEGPSSQFAARQVTSDRYYAALLLGRLRSNVAVPALIRATEDKTINYRAAMSLGEIGDTRAIPALHRMIEVFPERRLWGGYGLALLGEVAGFDVLFDIAVSDIQWTERRHAVEALGTIGDSKAVPTLVAALNDQHANVRVSAARSLGAIGDPVSIPPLTAALADTEVTQVNAPTTVEAEARKAIEAIRQRQP